MQIAQEARSAGLGSRLLATARELTAALHVSAVMCTCLNCNDRALAWCALHRPRFSSRIRKRGIKVEMLQEEEDEQDEDEADKEENTDLLNSERIPRASKESLLAARGTKARGSRSTR